MDSPDGSRATDFLVVGIGTSAGGIEALRGLFGGLPKDCGMAFVVVTHLDPTRESQMAEVIGSFAALPATTIENGMPVKPDRIYVIPPNAVVTIAKDKLRLSRPKQQRPPAPIDVFFVSLAEAYGGRAVAIVLSGLGHDGSLGLRAIREQGGLALAQGEGAAGRGPAFPDMPNNAAATGWVDLMLPVEEMGAKLVDYAANRQRLFQIGQPFKAPNRDDAVAAICASLRTHTGHDFTNYKRATVLRRLHRRMQVRKIPSVDAYRDLLVGDPAEIDQLFTDLLIGVTRFFRDPAAFEAVQRQAIPALLEGKGTEDRVRVWVPGCATGEEAYSIAMLLCESLSGTASPPTVQVFATDIDERSLALARAGRYSGTIVEDVGPERLRRFFTERDGSYRIRKELRDLCVFSTHSLIKHPPYSKIDLISCRNLLIYLDTQLQERVLPLFHYALRPGGFLFLGPSENVGRNANLFAPVDKKHRLFRRRDAGATVLPVFPTGRMELGSSFVGQLPRPRSPDALRDAIGVAEQAIVDQFSPAHVVVDRDHNIVQWDPLESTCRHASLSIL